ncbi:hypothetical protein [Nocardioides sp.]|uniref:hypothetical protein n=1 Tax=Nocardioides sp. TaxID=35761 RepID=UPI002735CFAD|nr:hypothetical protein [Nocardioides sp.]MDP3889844.1 hypothetical protein [Nocardioides sp.]
MPTHADHELDCESCSRAADVTAAFPDTTFRLCLRCVPAELRPHVIALPGSEQLVDLMLGFYAAHQQPSPPAPAVASTR